jgi:homoserine O-acetyltransferase
MELKPKYFNFNNFMLESGEILKELTIEYATFGRKVTDEEGNITNAVLYLHGWSGSFNSVTNIEDVIGPQKPINTDEYFIISPTAFGSPGSSSPSSTKLGPDFPKYTVHDMIQAHKIFLTNEFKIKHLKGVVGASMGGFQTLQWGVEHSDFIDFLIPIATGVHSGRQMKGAYGLMSQIISQDPDYNDGYYDKNPIKGLEMGSTIGFLFSLTPEYFEDVFDTDKEFYSSMDERNQEIADKDANDIIWRNDAMLNFNIELKTENIKIPTLIIGIENDQIFPPSISAYLLKKSILGSKLFTYSSIFGHYGCVRDLKKAGDAISIFINNL